MKRIYCLLFPVWFLCSCEKEIQFNDEIAEPVMVLNTYISPDSLVQVHLSESRFFLNEDSLFKIIEDADVEMVVNGSHVESLQYTGDGVYVSPYHIDSGDSIYINVRHRKLPDIACEGLKIPFAIPLESVSVGKIVMDTSNNSIASYSSPTINRQDTLAYYINKRGDVNITFSDPADEVNYYRLLLFEKTDYSDGTSRYRQSHYANDDPVFDNSMGTDVWGNNYNMYFTFSDILFNGKTYTIKTNTSLGGRYLLAPDSVWDFYKIEPSDYMLEDTVSIVKKVLYFHLFNITPSYYYFLSSKALSETSSNGIGEGLFSEPVQIYTNVKGGTGIMAGYADFIYSVDVTEFILKSE